MIYDYKSKKIQLALNKAAAELFGDELDDNIWFEEYKKFNMSDWWSKGYDTEYYVDRHYGEIILGSFDEDGINKSIGDFSCFYLYRYDPQGDYLDELENSAYISLDLCSTINNLLESKKWQDIYGYSLGVLYIERFCLNPNYRGKKLGYHIFPVLVDIFSKRHDTIVIINPTRDLDTEETTLKSNHQNQLAITKMQAFIKEFGFEDIEDSPFWAAALMDKGRLLETFTIEEKEILRNMLADLDKCD